LQQIIEGLMRGPYFPVAMDIMPAERRFLKMDGDSLNLHGAVISALPLNHPQGCAAYRIEADGGVLVLATDTEPGSPAHDASLRRLARNADLLFYDAQYTPQQSEGEKKGWGHSTWQEGVRIALEAGVKNLALFHHDPDSNDIEIDSLVARARQEFPNTTGAAEGTEFCLRAGQFSETPRSNG
jgi:ribonuclease BN (tRNA processing enzyme)